MKRTFAVAFFLAGGPALGLGGTYGQPGLSFKAGIGYDFLSQEYFLDSLTRTGADSLDISTSLETTYLENFKGQMALRYNPFQDNHLEIEGIYEQTSEEHRVRGYSSFRPTLGRFLIDWNSDMDWRAGSEGTEAVTSGYFSANSRLKISLPLSASVNLWGRVRAEKVAFDSSVWGALDHHRLSGEVGFSRASGGLSSLSGSGYISRRFVPDSHDQEYRSFGLDGSLLVFYERGEIDALTRWESRDYSRADNLDDYRRFDLNTRHRHNLSPRYFIRDEGELEVIKFDSTDYLTNSYTRFELAVLAGLTGMTGSAAIGPRVETLSEKQIDPQLISEDYVEYGIKGEFDLISAGWPFLSIESFTGKRDLEDKNVADGLHSDFLVERMSVLANWMIAAHLDLNLLLSVDWEWHELPQENSRLVLLSAGITYSF